MWIFDDGIYLVQLGFHPLAVVGRLVQKQERDSYIQKEKQYKNTEHTQQKTKTHKKQEKHKKNIKKYKSSNYKITKRSK